MRPLINIVLVALTAAGPWVCCCTTATISRATSKLSPVLGAKKRQPARTCCQHTPPRKSTDDRPANKPIPTAPAEQTGQHDPVPQGGACPCHEWRQELVAAKVSDGDSRLTPGSRDFASPTGFFLAAATSLRSLSGSPCAAAPIGSLLPFMSTDERLHAHHALRC